MDARALAAGGYARVPALWLDMDLSPQAKALLAKLCNVANSDGQSWYSYEQLAKIIKRSKASVCAYIAELRDNGILTTESQTTANGYNYRVKITLSYWSELLELWSAASKRRRENGSVAADSKEKSSTKTTKRRVQQAERNDPTGQINNLNKNYPTPSVADKPSPFTAAVSDAIIARNSKPAEQQEVVWNYVDEQEWERFRTNDRDPITVYGRLPSDELAAKLKSHINQLEALCEPQSELQKRACAQKHYQAFSDLWKLRAPSEAQEAFIASVVSISRDTKQVEAFFSELSRIWHPSWRELSSNDQIQRVFNSDAVKNAVVSNHNYADLLRFKGRLSVYSFARKAYLRPR